MSSCPSSSTSFSFSLSSSDSSSLTSSSSSSTSSSEVVSSLAGAFSGTTASTIRPSAFKADGDGTEGLGGATVSDITVTVWNGLVRSMEPALLLTEAAPKEPFASGSSVTVVTPLCCITPVSVVPLTVMVAAGVMMATSSLFILPLTYLNVPTDTLMASLPLVVAGS